MRGPLAGVDPLIAPILYTFQHAREDLARWTEGLTTEQIWATPHEFGSVGFHIRHIGGSTDRLLTYLQGRQLTDDQLAFLKSEKDSGAPREELLAEMETVFGRAEGIVRGIDPATLRDAREIGRKRLPTTVIGLLVHTAEHIQRHIGQAISAAKLARAQTTG
jgi:DinB superfamily